MDAPWSRFGELGWRDVAGAMGKTDSPQSLFGKLVAQLESVAASVCQQPPDAHLCFPFLSERVSAIEEECKETIIHWQRKYEDTLLPLLVKGPYDLSSIWHH